MREYLKRLPKEIQGLISLLKRIAAQRNLAAYLVGGFVRDLMLGVKNLDLDIVVEGDGINFAEGLAESFGVRLIRHRRFGTATIILNPKLKIDGSTVLTINPERSRRIDIASARKESYPEPAALPDVERSTIRDDLARRDFTINAMAISLKRSDFGSLVDFFGGEADLRQKKIRVLHDLSFIDDPTRILRAVRFEKRHNFRIEPRTLELIKEAVRKKMLEKVQPQRLRDELMLILKEENPMPPLKRMQQLAGFGFLSRGLALSKKGCSLLTCVKKQIAWYERFYPKRRKLDIWLIYFLALIEPLTYAQAKKLCAKFVFRKGEEKRILSFKKINPAAAAQLNRSGTKPSRIFSLLEPLSYEVILAIKAKYKNRILKKHIEDFFEIYNGMRLYIGGEDLHRLGVAPGPHYQKIFSRVLKAKLEGEVSTKEEELALIRKLVKK